MRLGLKRNEVKLVPYTSKWEEAFTKTRAEIREYTGLDDERIQHIGSTAIKGMHAKPIIDILVGVDTITPPDAPLIKALRSAGILRLRVERPETIVCAKFTDDTYQEKTHFVHLVVFQGDLWNDLLFFRDYLNKHEEAKETYRAIKQEFAHKASEGIEAYTEHKKRFVDEIFAKRNKQA